MHIRRRRSRGGSIVCTADYLAGEVDTGGILAGGVVGLAAGDPATTGVGVGAGVVLTGAAVGAAFADAGLALAAAEALALALAEGRVTAFSVGPSLAWFWAGVGKLVRRFLAAASSASFFFCSSDSS